MTEAKIAKLEHVDLRQVWNTRNAFTRWLETTLTS